METRFYVSCCIVTVTYRLVLFSLQSRLCLLQLIRKVDLYLNEKDMHVS